MFVRPFGASGVACDGKQSSHVQMKVVLGGGVTDGAASALPQALRVTAPAGSGAWLTGCSEGDWGGACANAGAQTPAETASISTVRNVLPIRLDDSWPGLSPE